MSARITVGIDVGGTFTDVVALVSGRVVTLKTPSDRDDPASAVLRGLDGLAERLGMPARELLAQTDLVHGTTLGLNTLLTRRGARTGLLCTSGFRDILEMRVGYKDHPYEYARGAPIPLVERRLRLPVRERVDAAGATVVPLVEEDVRETCRRFAAEGVDAIAICFLWSFLAPEHELRAAEICREELPGAYVTTSWDVLPELREYDRVSTTVLNAYVGPQVGAYVARLELLLGAAGHRGSLHYLQSNGGMASGEEIARVPVRTLLSGPAAGPWLGRTIAAAAGCPDAIVVDMGGTSFDASVITGGEIRRTHPTDIDSVRVGLPIVDIRAVDGGGGSIAHIDAGILRVGPDSAGGDPGPAAYGRGGTQPTVTDANVVLGVYAEGPLAGGVELTREPARQVLAALGDELGLDAERAAQGIWQVLTMNLARAVREITVAEGHDPRDYTLVAGGGAGPAHCCAIAEELDIRSVLVPRSAPTLCALGGALSDIVYESRRSLPLLLDAPGTAEAVDGVLSEIEEQIRASLAEEDHDGATVRIERWLELRYPDQLWELPCAVEDLPVTDASLTGAAELFHARHAELYGFAEPGSTCELVSVGVRIAVAPDRVPLTWPEPAEATWEPTGSRPMALVFSGEPLGQVPVYASDRAPLEVALEGPALIVDEQTSLLVAPGWTCRLERYGAFLLERGGS